MDANEIATLAQGLGAALADGLARNEAARAEAAEAKEAAAKRSEALKGVLRRAEREWRESGQWAAGAVADYCDALRNRTFKELKKDSRMPQTVNYLERYNALTTMQDRNEVLRLIGATLDKADRIVADAPQVDVAAAVADAARAYAQGLAGLNGIQIKAAEDADDEGAAVFADAGAIADFSDASDLAALEAAFMRGMGDIPAAELSCLADVQAAEARLQDLGNQIGAATKAAAEEVGSLRHQRARGVAGWVYDVGELPGFSAKVSCGCVEDPAQVVELAAEVRRSFATYKQVVQDNGLFGAFSNEGSYGACKPSLNPWWWGFWDDDEDERDEYSDIATSVEEDEGGDDLPTSIRRMKEFNKQRYWGLLDDDFQRHVDAFWYGFKKLMEHVNGLFKLDVEPFDLYCSALAEQAQERAASLGARMNGEQLDAFCKDVQAAQKRLVNGQ